MIAPQHQSLAELVRAHQASGAPLDGLLAGRDPAEKSALLRHAAVCLDCVYAEEIPAIAAGAIAVLPAELARRYGVVPLRAGATSVDLLALDPFDARTGSDLAFALGREVRFVIADPEKIRDLLRRHYGGDPGSAAPETRRDAETGTAVTDLSANDLEQLAAQEPVIRFVNLVLAQAVRDFASDIHFEPFEGEFKIRYRIDGALYEMAPPPPSLALPVASRLKVLAGLNIAERRVPQDGRIKLALAGRPVELRVSTLPTQFGESVVLRVLDQSVVQLDLAQLGLPAEIHRGIGEVIRRPNGIFLVTGPTGSGKTTTLYSALRALNTPGLKLMTAEDPVEYEIEGVMQTPVNPAAGLTFATALRSFLRQDPDVIMVGEIRDLETAQIAIQAALTGHLVLSTLHTNDAAGAVTRLIDLGVEPFLIASTLEAVLGQRLVRRLCRDCRAPCAPAPDLLEQLGLDRAAMGERQFFHGPGCAKCGQTGYKGRLGIGEWLSVTGEIRELITARAPTQRLRAVAIGQGMRPLRDAGLRAVFDGATSLEEVAKYI